MEKKYPIRVAVIGAGVCGLAVLRHLSTKQQIFQPVAFEMASVIGGTWNYSPDIGPDKYGRPVHSSMYDNVRFVFIEPYTNTNNNLSLQTFMD